MTEDTTAVYQRDVDGGTETILTGAWPQNYDNYVRARRHVTPSVTDDKIPGCENAQSRADHGASLGISFEANAVSYRTEHYRGKNPESGVEKVVTKVYTWGDGYVITAWVTRTGGQPPDPVKVGKLMIKQVEKLELDLQNDLP